MIYEWISCIAFLGFFGLPMAQDAWNDRSPRAPRKPERVWWARRRTAHERLRAYVRVKP